MLKSPTVLRLVVEPVSNGYIVEIEAANEDTKVICTTTRQLLRLIKERLALESDK